MDERLVVTGDEEGGRVDQSGLLEFSLVLLEMRNGVFERCAQIRTKRPFIVVNHTSARSSRRFLVSVQERIYPLSSQVFVQLVSHLVFAHTPEICTSVRFFQHKVCSSARVQC